MFDAVALAAVADELNEKILHGRVQDIVELDALTFGFEIYAHQKRHHLLAAAHPDDARVHLVSQKLRASGDPATPLKMLLQKHLEGALIDAVTQDPNERVLKIQFDHSVEGTPALAGGARVSTLVVETIGRYSNLILLDADAIILDAARRITPQLNRMRTILPRQVYAPPPPQTKTPLSALTIEKLATLLDDNRGIGPAQTLVKYVAGVSPLFAREIEFRIGERKSLASTGRDDAGLILELLKQLSQAPWQPSVAYEDDQPSDFAPYPITQSAKRQMFESISLAIETFYGAEEQYAALKETLRDQIAEARDKLARKRDSLTQSLPKQEAVKHLRLQGELLLGYASQVREGQKILKADSGDGIVEIALDERLSPVENAQKYFKEYHRAKDAFARVPALLQSAQMDLDYAEQIMNDLDLAENRAEIESVAQSAREARLIVESKRQRVKIMPSEPHAFESTDGFTILVGKNAKQNEEVTFKRSQPDDLWLHARNVAGAHVVILGNGREIPEATIQQAALLAAQNSQARSEARVDVIVTERKNVRKVRGGKPGMVTVRGERVVRVENRIDK